MYQVLNILYETGYKVDSHPRGCMIQNVTKKSVTVLGVLASIYPIIFVSLDSPSHPGAGLFVHQKRICQSSLVQELHAGPVGEPRFRIWLLRPAIGECGNRTN